MFDGSKMVCEFCGRKGHTTSFCPFTPNGKPAHKQIALVEKLMRLGQIDVMMYQNKPLAEAKQMLERLGHELNGGNPWREAAERTKARLEKE